MLMFSPPLRNIDFFNLDRPFGTRGHARGKFPVFQTAVAHIAFRDNAAFRIKLRNAIGTIPGAIPAADAFFFPVFDDPVLEFDISVRRASLQTRRIQAMIASHGKMIPFRVGINSAFDFSDPPPIDLRGIIVLFVTCHHTALASHAKRHVKMKTVLLPRLKRAVRNQGFKTLGGIPASGIDAILQRKIAAVD